MFAKKCLLISVLALHTTSGLVFDPDWPINLGLVLKRQDDMTTTEYNCHDNCGQAIIAARGTDPCNSTAFQHDYAACLQCAGADNVDIWRYYGGSLTSAAEACGLATAPLSGTQAAVSAAVTASTSAAASTTPASAAATATGTTSAAGNSSFSSTSASASASATAGGSSSATAGASATAASSAASSAAAASASASATGAANAANVGCISMIGALSIIGYFAFGF